MQKQEPVKVKVKNTSVLPSAVMLKQACCQCQVSIWWHQTHGWNVPLYAFSLVGMTKSLKSFHPVE